MDSPVSNTTPGLSMLARRASLGGGSALYPNTFGMSSSPPSQPLSIPLVMSRRSSTDANGGSPVFLPGTSPGSFLSASPQIAAMSAPVGDKEALAKFKAYFNVNLPPSVAVPTLTESTTTTTPSKPAPGSESPQTRKIDLDASNFSSVPTTSGYVEEKRNRDDAMARHILTGRMMDF